jgi:hypothetical protein
MNKRVETVQSAGALPDHEDLLNSLEQFVGPVQAGGPAAPVISVLLAALRGCESAPSISVPTAVSKMLGPLPQRFQWLATLLVPLLLGAGAGLPVWHAFFGGERITTEQLNQKVEAQAKTRINRVRAEADAQIRSNEDKMKSEAESRATKVLEQAKAEPDGEVKISQLAALNTELNQRIDAGSRENQSLKDQIHNLSAARAPARSGFVVWRGSRKGMVFITDDENKGLEGTLPAGPCLIEEVFGEHIDRKNAKGATCRGFSFMVTKNSPTTAYILWRTGTR